MRLQSRKAERRSVRTAPRHGQGGRRKKPLKARNLASDRFEAAPRAEMRVKSKKAAESQKKPQKAFKRPPRSPLRASVPPLGGFPLDPPHARQHASSAPLARPYGLPSPRWGDFR